MTSDPLTCPVNMRNIAQTAEWNSTMQMKNHKTAKTVQIVLFLAYIFFILWVTLLCRETGGHGGYTFELAWAYKRLFAGYARGPWWVKQNIGNVLFFVPFGLLFPGKKKWGLLWGFGLSVLTEVLQVVCHLGYGELDDVICNTLGTGIGLWMSWAVTNMIQKRSARKVTDEE